jgi:putative nucleotidyltransferase with HDIG domain
MSQYTNTSQPLTSTDHSRAQSSVDRWVGLSNLNRYLLGSNTLSDLLERATRSIVEILELTFAKVMILEPDGHYYSRMTYCDTIGAIENLDHIPVLHESEMLFVKLARANTPLLPYRMESGFVSENRLQFLDEGEQTIWLVPLAVNSQEIGILELGSQEVKESDLYLINSTHLVDLVAGQLSNAIYRIKLNEKLTNTSGEMVRALTKALEVRDSDSGLHSQNMATISNQLARRMGCSEQESLNIYWAALLHDIGKIGVEDKILHKPGKLDAMEWEMIRKHPEIGAKIVKGMTGLDAVAPLILYHHERMDGSGYPKRLKGDQIPLGARILAVVDTFSAIIEGRVYQPKRLVQEAVDTLKQESGIHLDGAVVDALIQMIQERAFIV